MRGKFIERWMAHHEGHDVLKDFFQRGEMFVNGVTPVVEQVMVQIDFDRANFGASAAERRSRGQMFPLLESTQVGRDNGADGSLVSRAVTVTADVFENGADIQTRAAANAMEGVTLLGIGEEFRAAVVQ